MKKLKSISYIILLSLIIISCSTENENTNITSQESLSNYLESIGFEKISSFDNKNELEKNIKPITFKSTSEAIAFFENFETPIGNINVNSEQINNKSNYSKNYADCTKRITLTNSYGLGTDFNVSYSATIGSNGEVSSVGNVNSSMTGNTLGISYDEEYSSATINNDGSVSTFTQGIINYNLFTEGIGTVWRSRVNIRTTYLPNPCGQTGGSIIDILTTFFLEYADNGNN